MAERYVTRRSAVRASEDGWYPDGPVSMTVLEDESGPVETGLLDQHGAKLYRVIQREPVGFRIRGKR